MRNNKGQAAIVICFSFILLFSLLAITLNIGIYIHDKINLQNSADLGAYAGASEQARLMQEIGYANYEIRQLYKRYIYDYRYRFSIDSDRDPIVSPSICVNFPFCDCIVRKSRSMFQGPVGYGIVDQPETCGTSNDRVREMSVTGHGSGDFVHQMPWTVNVPYDCAAQTQFNVNQANEIKAYYEGAFAQLLRKKLPALVDLVNADNGRAEQIARKTIRANLTSGNKNTEIDFPKPPTIAKSNIMTGGPRISLIQRPKPAYRIYYTTWTAVGPKPWCFYRGNPNCTVYTCVRHHAGGYVDVNIPLWFVKNPEVATYFTTRLTRNKSLFSFPFQFSRTAPPMSAVSAAKPFGSSIGWPDPYSEETIVDELYTRDDDTSPGGVTNKFETNAGGTVNPSYLDFMEAFYYFDDPAYQSLTDTPKFMPIPLVATVQHLNRLHFTFDSEAFIGMSNRFDRVRFETSWPYDPKRGQPGRSGYSVKFIPIRDLGGRYGPPPTFLPERDVVDH
jgi:hypothetical protein